MKSIWIKLISMLLILTTVCSVFAACSSVDNGEDSSDTNGSEQATDATGDEGAIPVFSNGEYTAKFIVGELASTFEKDIYNQIRTLFKIGRAHV